MDPVDRPEGINLQQQYDSLYKGNLYPRDINSTLGTKVDYLITHLETYSILLNAHNYDFFGGLPFFIVECNILLICGLYLIVNSWPH